MACSEYNSYLSSVIRWSYRQLSVACYFRGYLYFQSVLDLGKAKERLVVTVSRRKTFGFSEVCFLCHFLLNLVLFSE